MLQHQKDSGSAAIEIIPLAKFYTEVPCALIHLLFPFDFTPFPEGHNLSPASPQNAAKTVSPLARSIFLEWRVSVALTKRLLHFRQAGRDGSAGGGLRGLVWCSIPKIPYSQWCLIRSSLRRSIASACSFYCHYTVEKEKRNWKKRFLRNFSLVWVKLRVNLSVFNRFNRFLTRV